MRRTNSPRPPHSFSAKRCPTAQLLDLAGDTKRLAAVKAGDFPALRRAAEELTKAARDLRLAFPQNPIKSTFAELTRYDKWPDALKTLSAALDETAKLLESQAERDADLKNCFERAQAVQVTLASWQRDDDPEHPRVRWLETTLSSLLLHATPLSVGAMFGAKLTERAQAWILTSATLSVGGDFTHLKTRLGIEAAETLCVDSPFDYPRQGVLYVPQNLPAPNTPDFTEAVVNAALPVLEVSQGRAFILFTSLRALDKARGLLIDAFKFRGWDYPLTGAGRRAEERAARALSTGRQRRVARQPELLGGRRHAGRCAVGRHHRQTAVPAARRPGRRRAHRPGREEWRQALHGLPVAACGDHAEAGGWAADPHRDRSRRADDLRYAAGGQAVWALAVECAAGDDADEEAGGGGAVFCGGG